MIALHFSRWNASAERATRPAKPLATAAAEKRSMSVRKSLPTETLTKKSKTWASSATSLFRATWSRVCSLYCPRWHPPADSMPIFRMPSVSPRPAPSPVRKTPTAGTASATESKWLWHFSWDLLTWPQFGRGWRHPVEGTARCLF